MESDLPKKPKKKLTPLEAQEKIRNWCAYQERSPLETKYKLLEYGLNKNEAEQVLASLIEENFVNEERFATAFARGKFRIKKWGKQRIKAELRMRKISDYSMNKALKQLEDSDYVKTVAELLTKKAKAIKEKNPVKKRYKLIAYAISKGYEKNMISDILKEMANDSDN